MGVQRKALLSLRLGSAAASATKGSAAQLEQSEAQLDQATEQNATSAQKLAESQGQHKSRIERVAELEAQLETMTMKKDHHHAEAERLGELLEVTHTLLFLKLSEIFLKTLLPHSMNWSLSVRAGAQGEGRSRWSFHHSRHGRRRSVEGFE